MLTVEGKITRVLGDCDYVLEPHGVLEMSEVLTLCDPEASSKPPADAAVDDWLRITGVAGTLSRPEYEYITTLTLPDDIFSETETRPVIFVHSAQIIEHTEDGKRQE
ncbi:MAG: hypothetical protein R2724_17245 [Bryobacterales bacterium]